MEHEDNATRVARILSQAMNVLTMIESCEQGNAINRPMLHRILGSLIPELEWLDAHQGDQPVEGLSWPVGAADRLARPVDRI